MNLHQSWPRLGKGKSTSTYDKHTTERTERLSTNCNEQMSIINSWQLPELQLHDTKNPGRSQGLEAVCAWITADKVTASKSLQGVLGRFFVTPYLASRKLQLQLIDGNRPCLNFHNTISSSLRQPILTLLRKCFKWDAHERINLMNKTRKRTCNILHIAQIHERSTENQYSER